MTDFDALHEDWVVWNEDPGGRCVLAYRPDVFDADAFPAPCLPTIFLTRGRRNDRRPGVGRDDANRWFCTLSLEPDVAVGTPDSYADRTAAVEGVCDLARRFAEGAVDYRTAYQVPRETYLDRLDELTGRAD